MILFKQIELLQRIHRLINASCTGTPEEFARRMRISERHLREIIVEMKDLGAPIEYSRRNETYYYKEPFEIDISCTFQRLSDKDQKNISAGITFLTNFSFTAFFVP
ncbi:MAG: helix-turn-helix domain-containing protein [Candidatus Azobacteroides sp.]|nr:helix-turn-helix domain-containing protein [Candidatus Azobacteroides sp.]